jgi:hypothetical protein
MSLLENAGSASFLDCLGRELPQCSVIKSVDLVVRKTIEILWLRSIDLRAMDLA